MKRERTEATFARTAELLNKFEELERQHEVAKFQFITTELDIASMFSQIAIKANDQNDEDKAERSAELARQAYDGAQRFLSGAHLSPTMSQEIDERLNRLEPLLQRLADRCQF